jgi:hypothetical protein
MDKNEDVIPPAAKQPEIVEGRLGVREYWFETFRRVLVIPEDNAITLSIDVYKKLNGLPEGYKVVNTFTLAQGRVRVYFLLFPEGILSKISLGDVKPSQHHLLVVEAQTRHGEKRLEAVNVRLTFTGVRNVPSREDVWRLYRSVVKVVEGRDPETEPLKPPELVRRVYAFRLSTR